MDPPIPAVPVADNADPPRIWRPNGKRESLFVTNPLAMSAKNFIKPSMLTRARNSGVNFSRPKCGQF